MRPAIRNIICSVLLISGLSGLWMMVGPAFSSATGIAGVNCTSLQDSAMNLLNPANVPLVGKWQNTAQIRRNTLAGAHLIVNHQGCFDPTLVATAQMALDH